MQDVRGSSCRVQLGPHLTECSVSQLRPSPPSTTGVSVRVLSGPFQNRVGTVFTLVSQEALVVLSGEHQPLALAILAKCVAT